MEEDIHSLFDTEVSDWASLARDLTNPYLETSVGLGKTKEKFMACSRLGDKVKSTLIDRLLGDWYSPRRPVQDIIYLPLHVDPKKLFAMSVFGCYPPFEDGYLLKRVRPKLKKRARSVLSKQVKG